ncbi:MAG: ABC transporter permease [Thermoplasmata archaeon]
MSVSRVLAVTRKSLGQISNDRRTLGFILVVPLVLVLVFGYGFGGQPSHVATSVVNADAGPAGAKLLADLPSGTLDLHSVSSPSMALNAVRTGDAWAAIVIPANFSSDLARGHATLTVDVDGSSPTTVAAVLGAVQTAIQRALGASPANASLTIAPDYIYGSASTSFVDTLAPGVMALVAVFATTILAILVLVREKSQGLLERLFASPLRPWEFVAGHGLSLAVVAVAQTLVVLVAAIVVFQATFVGNLAFAFGILTLFALGNIGLGMLISALAQSEFQAVQLIPLLLFPQLLFSGALFPIDSIPLSFRPVSSILPLTYASDALRGVLLRGWGPGPVGWDLLALALYALVTLGGATALVRRQA